MRMDPGDIAEMLASLTPDDFVRCKFGTVMSVSASSFNCLVDGDSNTVPVVRGCGASVGNRVLIVVVGGEFVAISTVGADFDTGWVDLNLVSTSGSGFVEYSSTWGAAYRVRNGFVTVQGAVSPNSVRLFDTTEQKFSSVPSAFAPARTFAVLMQSSSTYTICFRGDAAGNLTLSRLISGSGDYSNCSLTTWMPFYITYPLKN